MLWELFAAFVLGAIAGATVLAIYSAVVAGSRADAPLRTEIPGAVLERIRHQRTNAHLN